MDRRGFLRSAGTTVASGCLLTATSGFATASRHPQWNDRWREYLSNPGPHPLIPNVSYAGYHRGERPGVRAVVTSFGAVGDGMTDCTAARRLRPELTDYSAMVGIRGTTGPTDHPKDFTGDVGSVADALDQPVYPSNLYEAQLRHRLRGTR